MSLWVNIDMLWWRRGVVADGARRGGTAADRTARSLSLRLHDVTTEVSLHSMTVTLERPVDVGVTVILY